MVGVTGKADKKRLHGIVVGYPVVFLTLDVYEFPCSFHLSGYDRVISDKIIIHNEKDTPVPIAGTG